MKHRFSQIKPAHFNSKILFFIYFLLLTFHFSLSYSQQPTQEWVARYLRPSGSGGLPNQMALDKVGNCYILGNIYTGNSEMVLIKYDPNGDTIWTKIHNVTGNDVFFQKHLQIHLGGIFYSIKQ